MVAARPGGNHRADPGTSRHLQQDTRGSYHQRIQGGRKERNRQALVATAHYLARVMLAMLKTGEAWREPDSNGSVQPPQAMPEMTCKQAA